MVLWEDLIMGELPWKERVVSFQINPESATTQDVARMAVELTEAIKLITGFVDAIPDHLIFPGS
jgi:hypothetical protein